MSRGSGLAMLVALLFVLQLGAVAESWPIFRVSDWTANLDLSETLTYARQGDQRLLTGSPEQGLSVQLAGYSLHPYLLSWNAQGRLATASSVRVKDGNIDLQVLPLSLVRTFVTGSIQSEELHQDFRPSCRLETDTVSVLSLLGTWQQPITARYTATERVLEDPEIPEDMLTLDYALSNRRQFGRDATLDFEWNRRYALDRLSGHSAEGSTLKTALDNYFLYDLLHLRSSYQRNLVEGDRPGEETRLAETLDLQHRENWASTLTLEANRTRVESRLVTEVKGEVSTTASLGKGWQGSLSEKARFYESGDVSREALGPEGGLQWNGDVGPLRLTLGATGGWLPERGQGNIIRPVLGEIVCTTEGPARLQGANVVVDSIRVSLGHRVFTRGIDYELWLPLGVNDDVAPAVDLIWRGDPSIKEVRVSYDTQRPAGDSERITYTGNLTASTTADTLSFRCGLTSYHDREYSLERGNRIVNSYGSSQQLALADGPFSLTTTVYREDHNRLANVAFVYTRDPFTLTWRCDREKSSDAALRRDVVRGEYQLVEEGFFRLKGFAQALVRTDREAGRAVEDKAVQTGIQALANPRPGLRLSASLGYVRNFVNATRHQLTTDFRADYRLGLLSVNLEAGLEEDLGRDAARGRLEFGVRRCF
ncbi:MAG: hypothetical protein ACM3RP_12800 [Chitinophagales bacterium]